jgi:hypothetical protein
MMANGAPTRLCWLAPWLDVLGSETDWNRNGVWRPLSNEELLFRRALSGPKPYCFLMNTDFEAFPPEKVERYMKRCLAYGMFPGFFSHNASEGHYFTRPELYNRTRPLFKKYVPLCKRLAEAGWRSVTRARSREPEIRVERFGDRLLTVFNDSPEVRRAVITLDGLRAVEVEDLLTHRYYPVREDRFALSLSGEDVAVIHLKPIP